MKKHKYRIGTPPIRTSEPVEMIVAPGSFAYSDPYKMSFLDSYAEFPIAISISEAQSDPFDEINPGSPIPIAVSGSVPIATSGYENTSGVVGTSLGSYWGDWKDFEDCHKYKKTYGYMRTHPNGRYDQIRLEKHDDEEKDHAHYESKVMLKDGEVIKEKLQRKAPLLKKLTEKMRKIIEEDDEEAN